VDVKGIIEGTPPYEAGIYRPLCLNSPYIESFFIPHVREILETPPTDGLFFDIVMPIMCACRYCRAKMEAEDLDPTDAQVCQQYSLKTTNLFKQDMTCFMRQEDRIAI
jgi:hypothetical protein